jgi:hypothetical protein
VNGGVGGGAIKITFERTSIFFGYNIVLPSFLPPICYISRANWLLLLPVLVRMQHKIGENCWYQRLWSGIQRGIVFCVSSRRGLERIIKLCFIFNFIPVIIYLKTLMFFIKRQEIQIFLFIDFTPEKTSFFFV